MILVHNGQAATDLATVFTLLGGTSFLNHRTLTTITLCSRVCQRSDRVPLGRSVHNQRRL